VYDWLCAILSKAKTNYACGNTVIIQLSLQGPWHQFSLPPKIGQPQPTQQGIVCEINNVTGRSILVQLSGYTCGISLDVWPASPAQLFTAYIMEKQCCIKTKLGRDLGLLPLTVKSSAWFQADTKLLKTTLLDMKYRIQSLMHTSKHYSISILVRKWCCRTL